MREFHVETKKLDTTTSRSQTPRKFLNQESQSDNNNETIMENQALRDPRQLEDPVQFLKVQTLIKDNNDLQTKFFKNYPKTIEPPAPHQKLAASLLMT